MSVVRRLKTKAALALCVCTVCASFGLLVPSRVAAEEPVVDRQERLFGATRINAALGHGGLTVGISHVGELTVLRWPNPSFFEHLNYTTAGGEGARQLPLFGAQPNEGSFAGLVLRQGQTLQVIWLRDPGWIHQQAYLSETVDTLRTIYRNDKLKVTVEGTDVVDPRRDLLARRFKVSPDPGAGFDGVSLIYFENMAPNVEKAPFVPVEAHGKDHERDYALVYDAARDALLHGSVEGRPQSLLDKLPAQADDAEVKDFLVALGSKQGAFFAIGGSMKSTAFQCGVDAVDGKGLTGGPQDAFDDAADGALSGSRAATSHATGALAFDLGATGGEVTIYIAAGETAAGAGAELELARAAGFIDVEQASAGAWADWLEGARLPSTTDSDQLRVARRALITIRTAMEPTTGAVVASIAQQPAYAEDWPRDGAFINHALDVAGKHTAVTKHNRSYAAWQRERDDEQVFGGAKAPAGSFAMSYYPDGVPAGFIPFEIDHVGLALWTFYRHATFLADPKARDAYLGSVWTAIERAANLLVTCKDPTTGLQCAANEDDDVEQSISLHGTAPSVLGLRSAIRAARYLGHDQQAQRWLERLRELEAAMETYLGVEGAGYTGIVPGQSTEIWPPWRRTGALAWAVWPGELEPHGQRRMVETAAEVRRQLEPFFTKQNNGGAYHAKGLLALAMHYSSPEVDDSSGIETVRRWIDLLVKEVAIPGTDHFGEAYVYEDLDGDGDREHENRVSIPHVWEAALIYLSLMAAYDPEQLQPPHLAEVEPAADGCCRLGATGQGASGSAGCQWSVLLVLLLLRLRRRSES